MFSTLMLDSHRLSEAGHTHLVWLNVGLSLVAAIYGGAMPLMKRKAPPVPAQLAEDDHDRASAT